MSKKEPMKIMETPGVKYYCKCGKSARLPYCDGNHEGTGCVPQKMEIESQQEIAICTCGLSSNSPFCDGSHLNC
jgi:CDGSH-type Zn-finger protein